eukprot:SAG25_NODE_555_length_6955_cov_15.736289_4_plen_112_part_00
MGTSGAPDGECRELLLLLRRRRRRRLGPGLLLFAAGDANRRALLRLRGDHCFCRRRVPLCGAGAACGDDPLVPEPDITATAPAAGPAAAGGGAGRGAAGSQQLLWPYPAGG